MKGCLKGCLTSIVLLIVSSVILGFLGWKYVKKQFLSSPPTAPTVTTLEVDTGTVSRNGFSAKTGDTLNSGDKVHTAKNSAATLTFPDNSVLRLDENTDITVTSASNLKISIFQSLGRTWSRVIKLVDSNHAYEIETPTAVATVRGTAFATNVNLDQSTNIDADEDIVDVSTSDRKNRLSVEAGFGTDLSTKQQKLFKRAIREELKNSPWYQNNRRRDRQLIEKLNRIENTIQLGDLAKIQRLVARAQSGKLNLTPDQLAQLKSLNLSMAPDVAQALAIVSPEDFSDTAHWTAVARSLIPLLSKLQPLRFVSTE